MLATLLGHGGTRIEYLTLVAAAYLSILAAVVLRLLPIYALITLVTLPRAVRVWRVVRDETDPLALTRGGLRGTADLHQRVGLLLAIAFFLP